MADTNENRAKLDYLFNSVLLYATVGLGTGLVIILLSEFGTYPFEMTGMGEMAANQINTLNEQFFSTVALFAILLVVILAPLLSGLAGLLAAGSFTNKSEAVIYSAGAAFLGTFVFVLLVVFLSSTALTEETASSPKLRVSTSEV